MTVYVPQRAARDCVICTLAMATGRSYDSVMAAALLRRAYEPDVGVRNEQSILAQLGLAWRGDFVEYDRGILDAEYFKNVAWGRRAVMSVPSLNDSDPKLEHSVYWSGNRLYDPSLGRRYADWSLLRPSGMILFHERR